MNNKHALPILAGLYRRLVENGNVSVSELRALAYAHKRLSAPQEADRVRACDPTQGAVVSLTQGEKDTLARIANARAAGIKLDEFWVDWEASRRTPAASEGQETPASPSSALSVEDGED